MLPAPTTKILPSLGSLLSSALPYDWGDQTIPSQGFDSLVKSRRADELFAQHTVLVLPMQSQHMQRNQVRRQQIHEVFRQLPSQNQATTLVDGVWDVPSLQLVQQGVGLLEH